MVGLVRFVARRAMASSAARWTWVGRAMLIVSAWRWWSRRRSGSEIVRLRSGEVLHIDVEQPKGTRR